MAIKNSNNIEGLTGNQTAKKINDTQEELLSEYLAQDEFDPLSPKTNSVAFFASAKITVDDLRGSMAKPKDDPENVLVLAERYKEALPTNTGENLDKFIKYENKRVEALGFGDNIMPSARENKEDKGTYVFGVEIHPSLAPLAGAINGMDDKVNSVIKESANFASNLITGGVADYKAEPSKFGNISDVAMDKLNKVKASISTWWDNGTARSDLPTNVTAVAKAESVTQPIPDKTIPVNNSFGGRVDLSQLEKPLPTPKVSVVKYLGL